MVLAWKEKHGKSNMFEPIKTMHVFFERAAHAFSALISSTAALVLVATATCLLINMHLRKSQNRTATSDSQLNARLGRIQHLVTRAEPVSLAVAASCGPACTELKTRLGKLENKMTRVLDAVDKTPSNQCLSCHKLELLIAQLTYATDKNKSSQGASAELVKHSLPPRLVRRAQSSSDLVSYNTQPQSLVRGSSNPYLQRGPCTQQVLSKGMSPSLGPTDKLSCESQRNTPSRRRSCESVCSSSSMMISPEFDSRWPMLVSPTVAKPAAPRSEGRIKLDLIRSIQARKSHSSCKSSDFPPFMKCTVDEALQLLDASPGKIWPDDFSEHV